MTQRWGDTGSEAMSIRETIHAEIESVPDQQLGELLRVVRDFAHRSSEPTDGESDAAAKPTIFDRLLTIKIQGPPDFSENVELYASGEKRFEDGADLR
jgi:hypothetical protein